MNQNRYFAKLSARLARVGIRCPDYRECPRAFQTWRDRRRNASAARRCLFPTKGTGWVFVPAAR